MEILAALIQAVAAVGVVAFGFWRLERHEIRKARVQCLLSLFGSRYALMGKPRGDHPSEISFYTALNQLPYLYSDDREVMTLLRDIHHRRASGDRNAMPLVMRLLRIAAKGTYIDLGDIADAEMYMAFGSKEP